ncbi:MAG: ABC transporter permease subunit [Anaerolineae bacterium]|nr:ABC transporter permease subunit [Anaerolineae bacterium]
MNIYFRELKANLKSLLIWSGIVVLFVLVGFSKFSAYEGNPELLAIMDSMPKALVEAMSLKAFNLTTVTGFLGLMFTYFGLILSVAAGMWGTDIITKEERDRTVEFSLTLPVTRGKVITGKLLAAVTHCILLLLVTWGSILLGAANYQTTQEFFDFLSLIIPALGMMQLIFLAIGILLGCAMKHYKRASSITMFILLGMYMASIFSGLNEKLEFLKYVSPFKYFNPAVMLNESRLEWPYLLITAGIIGVCLLGAYFTYQRRDLYI